MPVTELEWLRTEYLCLERKLVFQCFNWSSNIRTGNLTSKRENEAEINIGVIEQRVDQMKDNVATEIYQSLSDLK